MSSTGSGTTVIYNGVTIQGAMTREWDQEVVYDPSGQDKAKDRWRFAFEGLIHIDADAPAVVGHASPVTSATESYQRIARLLSTEQERLQVYFGAELVIDIVGQSRPACGGSSQPAQYQLAQPNRDVENGPKPQHVRLVHICSDKLFRVEFSIECVTSPCSTAVEADGSPRVVLNNRWSLAEDMDRNHYVTRTLSGRLTLSTQMVPAHLFKRLVVPGLEAGFARDSIHYEVAASGLEADYTVVDRQVKHAAPAPATKLSGSHGLATADGVTFTTRFNLRLEAPPHVHTRELIKLAFQVLDKRTRFVAKVAGVPRQYIEPSAMIQSFAITEILGDENVLELSAELLELPEKQVEFLANLSANVLGEPLEIPDYDPQVSPQPALYGYQPWTGLARSPAVLLLLHPRLMAPCCGDKSIGSFPTVPSQPGEAQPQNKPRVKAKKVASLSEKHAANFSPQASRAIYSIARMSSVYTRNPLVVALPIAAPPTSSTSTGKKAEEQETTAFVSLTGNRGAARRIVTYEAERVGKPPELPEPVDRYADGGIQGRLIDQRIESRPPHTSPDGQQLVFYASAEYVYALNRPPTQSEDYRIGALPFTSLQSTDAIAQFNAKQAFGNSALQV